MVFKRTRPDSDYDEDFVPPPPRKKRALSLPPSSPPPMISSDSESDTDFEPPLVKKQPIFTPEDESTMENLDSLPRLPPLFPLPLPIIGRDGQLSEPHTPRRIRAGSLDPPASSPMSILDVTPLKSKLGRPVLSPETRRLRATVRKLSSSQRSPDKQKVTMASKELKRKEANLAAAKQQMADLAAEAARKAAAEAAKAAAAEKSAADAADTRRAQDVVRRIITPAAEGGFNFKNMDHFFDAMWRKGGDGEVSLLLTNHVKRHGVQHARAMFERSAQAKDKYISSEISEIYEREGRAIQTLLTRQSTTTVTELLEDFSMEELAAEIQEKAPNLWAALS
ncbi:hypothetical protein R3P38DRAFT_3245105 [Favolaschia claudopus]|uniref:Uncharacterized protein n=1 Tax=Favolaschia claudopus TaxID=2862362 RepID=A0AAV9Z0X8_9AGAR